MRPLQTGGAAFLLGFADFEETFSSQHEDDGGGNGDPLRKKPFTFGRE
jgi:hypothetical protein